VFSGITPENQTTYWGSCSKEVAGCSLDVSKHWVCLSFWHTFSNYNNVCLHTAVATPPAFGPPPPLSPFPFPPHHAGWWWWHTCKHLHNTPSNIYSNPPGGGVATVSLGNSIAVAYLISIELPLSAAHTPHTLSYTHPCTHQGTHTHTHMGQCNAYLTVDLTTFSKWLTFGTQYRPGNGHGL